MKNFNIIIVLLLLSVQLSAQPYGNEWVNSSQTYFKFKIAENGLYRISRAELEAAGFPVSTVPASRIQLYRNGEEQSIRVTSSGGILESLDFYGLKNDGQNDFPLYRNGSNQMHPEFSLFTDSASYFLTFPLNNISGKRMESYSEANTQGIPLEDFYTKQELRTFIESYSSGRRFNGGDITLSSYDRGEGWVGNAINSNPRSSEPKSQDLNFNLIGGTTSIGNPSISLTIAGVNNNAHNVRVEAGPNTESLRTISSFGFSARDHRTVNLDLAWSDVGSDANLVVRVTPSATVDRIAISTARLSFPSAFIINREDTELNLSANAGGTSFIRATETSLETELFDVTNPNNPIEIGINRSSDSFLGVIRNTSEERKLLVTENLRTIGQIREVTIPSIDPSLYNYIIVTHADLRTNGDQVNRYANYRESEAGGGYQVLVSEIDQLYDLFSYGDQSPLAVRNLSDWMLDNGDPRFLFIIGKGLTPASNYYRLGSTDLINFVPTFGHPGTDVPYTSGINGQGFESEIPTGRINAFVPSDISNYLNKVIEMEAAPFNDISRKRALLLSGGQTTNEQESFRGFIQDFDDVLSGDFLGGSSILFSKTSSENVAFINVTDEINQGVSLVTFFGHSSASTTDIEVGQVSDPALGYRNKGKYPVFLVNGCNAGNFFGNQTLNSSRDFGDDWILTPDLGAVGFLASSSFALSGNLKGFSDVFLENAYARDDFFGRSLGEIVQLTGADYINRFGNSQANIAQVQQFSLNGDPAVTLYGTEEADYSIEESDVTFVPIGEEIIVASTDSFDIQIALKNFGRLVNEPVEVAVLRTLQDGTVINYDPVAYDRVNSQDTLTYRIRRNPEIDETGNSLFEIFVDPLNKTPEVNEDNNIVALSFDIFSGSTSNLYPLNYGIVPDTRVELVYQLSDLNSEERTILIELDTTDTFNSPLKKNNIIPTNVLGRWEVDIDFGSLEDGQVFYWRTRLQDPDPTESDEWVNNSFSYISGSPEGWRQSSSNQLQSAFNSGVTLSDSKQWAFESEETPIVIKTFGSNTDPVVFNQDSVQLLVQGSNFLVQTVSSGVFPGCSENTLNAVVFDRRSAQPYNPVFIPGVDLRNRLVCGRRPQVVYNMFESDVTGIVNGVQGTSFLDSLINESELGDVVVLFNIGNLTYSNWTPEVINKLGEIGIAPSSINNLTDGQPIIFIGTKGSTPGTAFEFTDNGSGLPITEQFLSSAQNISGSNGEGNVSSVRIGPSSNWLDFQQQVNLMNSEDASGMDIFGVNGTSKELLASGVSEDLLDLSSIDAEIYPFIELEWSFSDIARQTPPQLDAWQVLFETLPDGLLIDDNLQTQVQEGENYSPRFGFLNYTETEFQDSIKVAYSVFNRNNRSFFTDSIMIAPPMPGDTVFFNPSINTVGFVGENDLNLRVNLNNVPEQYSNNNLINRSSLLVVNPDQINPVLDVTFDGQYIRNGAIISPNPAIVVTLRDENEFFLKSDTLGVLMFIKPPCETCEFERINFSDEEVTWEPATESAEFQINYSPIDLTAGTYSFRVQAEDASGNASGLAPYEIDFNIDTEASISNFTAFPNPILDGVRFSFTLTGLTPPEDFNIHIYSLRGQLIQVISQERLGEMKIGFNVTDVIWDGTDDQGRFIDNGIYLYRVSMRIGDEVLSGSEIENGIGRLYLLR